MRDREGDPYPDQLLKAGNVGDQVGVEVIAVQGAPELAVRRAAQQVVQDVQLLDGLRQRRVTGSWEGGGGRGGG